MPRLCLHMIVQDDIANLRLNLASFASAIDAWVIADVGSTDGSAEYVREFFAARGIPGRLVTVPFHNFAQARNEALNACRRSDLAFDYILLANVDQMLVVEDRSFRSRLDADSHMVMNRSGVSYALRSILKRSAVANYRGVTHEILEVAGRAPTVPGIHVIRTGDIDVMAQAARNAELLLKGLKLEQDPLMRARYTFYLGNAQRTLGDFAAARRSYLERARLGFWEEEVYCARLYAARAAEALGRPASDVIQELANLNNDMMHRAEAMHAIARICRQNQWWEQAYLTAEAAASIDKPTGALFLEDWIYDYGAIDELAVAAYWTGRLSQCAELCDALLASGWLSGREEERVRKNRALADRAMKSEPAVNAGAGAPSYTSPL